MSEMTTSSSSTPAGTTAADDAAFEQHCAEDAIWTGGRLWIGAEAFFFAGLGFAYFYLRSFNNGGLWRPNHVTAPTSTGTAVFALVVAGAALQAYGGRHLRRGAQLDWEVAGWVTVVLGLLAAGLQAWELTQLSFFPGSSGYASCFIAWAIMNTTLILGATYWIETLLAKSLRLRKGLHEDGGTGASQMPTARLFRANLDAATYFLWFAAVINLLFWITFYVI